MDMRMQAEVLSPGMKYTDRTAFHTVMTVAESSQGIPHRSKQMIVKPPAIQQAEGIKPFGDGKDNVKMLYPIRILNTVFDPKSLFGCLAGRAMTVSATVITDVFSPATITTVFMPTQCRSPAFC
jgi:hypothetical protein